MRKAFLPILALLAAAGALLVLWKDQTPPPIGKPTAEPAQAPFAAYISAAGLVESPTTNLAVTAPVTGIVQKVYVRLGQRVRAGEPLFLLDDASQRAEVARLQTALLLAEKRLRKWELGTRPEELATQEAQVAQARAAWDDARRQLELRRKVADSRAVSADEVLQQEANVRQKEQQWNVAQQQMALLRAGSWQPDVEIARTEVAAARDELAKAQVALDRLTVRAPLAGEILQLSIQPGELVAAAATGPAPILLGETATLHLRAEVDEDDAWRVQESRPALAFPRGRPDLSIPLRFVRIEPLVGSKKNLTGESTERVDTRVLAVVYELQKAPVRLFVGQQLDVYIEAEPWRGQANLTAASAKENKP